MKKHIKLIAIIMISSFVLFSCNNDEDTNPVDGNSNTAIKGRVTGNAGYGSGLQKVSSGIEGATVTTAEIQSNGSFKAISEASVQTNANGEFELTSNSAGKSNIVVMATKNSTQWKAMISSEIKAEQTNYSPPVNEETTGEVDVYSEVIADNQESLVGYADVAFYVDSKIAAKVKNNSNERKKVKDAVVAEKEARNSTFRDSHYGYSDDEVKDTKVVEKDAQKEFETDLYLSSDTEASYDMAWESYYNTLVSGYSNTSISLTDYAEIKEVSGKVMSEMSSDLDAEAKFQLQKRNSYLKAKLIAKAMINEYDKVGADNQSKQEVENYNNNLLISIKASNNVNDINDAYANYKSEVKANLNSSFSTYASAFATVESVIETSLITTLKTGIAASTNMQAIIKAYTTFYSNIDATVSSEVQTSDSNQIKAISNIYALISMNN